MEISETLFVTVADMFMINNGIGIISTAGEAVCISQLGHVRVNV